MKRSQQDKLKIEELKKSYESMASDMNVSEEKLKLAKEEIKTLKAQKKYIIVKDGTLFQIVSKLDFDDVKTGDVGGHVANANNLSHKGKCWIYKGAQAIENSKVMGNAKIKGNAVVSGSAMIYENASVEDSALATEDAMIHKKSIIKGDAIVKGNVHVRGGAIISGNSVLSGQIIVSGKNELIDKTITGENMKRIKTTTFK